MWNEKKKRAWAAVEEQLKTVNRFKEKLDGVLSGETPVRSVEIDGPIRIDELAAKLKVSAGKLIKALWKKGMRGLLSDTEIAAEAARAVAGEMLGARIESEASEWRQVLFEESVTLVALQQKFHALK